jgi:hypothetical protein
VIQYLRQTAHGELGERAARKVAISFVKQKYMVDNSYYQDVSRALKGTASDPLGGFLNPESATAKSAKRKGS